MRFYNASCLDDRHMILMLTFVLQQNRCEQKRLCGRSQSLQFYWRPTSSLADRLPEKKLQA
ncbi:hypothetical protein CW354_02465 [Marinicaulis flavus]|uniref:Uncharacterized protein n=1 Tax=Hyphococcus luteus TaxID=2058213 RepID=A0A2S7KBD0_9PROT|nr:hypothetical protein CW354_02465 [Marinicaulis flavus]